MAIASRLAWILMLMFNLLGCTMSGYQVGQMIPQGLGGESKAVPPPRNTQEYEDWLKKPGPMPEGGHRQR